MSWLSVWRDCLTSPKSGWGFPRQKFESVHVAFRSILSFEPWWSCCSRGGRAPACRTRSRHGGLSPAMLPRAHTACSRTSSLGLSRSRTKMGTAPTSMTTLVCSLVPLAMLVRAHAASNWSAGLSSLCRNSTKRGTTPESMTCWMGGFFSIDRRRRNCVVHSVWIVASVPMTPWTIWGRFSSLLAVAGLADEATSMLPATAPSPRQTGHE